MKSYRFGFLLIALSLSYTLAPATPYWSAQDYLNFKKNQPQRSPQSKIPLPVRSIDQYNWLVEFAQICQFLTTMQETDSASSNFGGMHEGETVFWSIVQTDNTQEAIRIWSLYAQLSGDLETFRQYIDRAWIYTMNFPAYLEENPDGEYYRVHNCGWGLVAESKYREAYGDDSYLWYADSCAKYIETHRLPYTGTWATLNPLVEGWAAGTLYDYGVEQSDSLAKAHALSVGADVQAWIEADSNRLNNNEDWAMCGGTALWGVCRSVFAADPQAGQAWLPAFLPYLSTYAEPSGSGWNNSWNAWYTHAWNAAAVVLNDSACTQNAFALVDTLLDADHPADNDGGITATSTNPPTMDQSWTTSYLGYMGIIPLFSFMPQVDAVALGFLQPDTTQLIAQGTAVPVAVLVGNAGQGAFGNVTAAISVNGNFWSQGTTLLSCLDIDTVVVGLWTPSDPGDAVLSMCLSPSLGPTANDTASLLVHVRGWGQIRGTVRDQASGSPLQAAVKCYSDDFPSAFPNYVGYTDSATGFYQVEVTEGSYHVVVDPQIPYTDRTDSGVVVQPGLASIIDFALSPAPILLVDDDGGAQYEQFYITPLAEGGYDAYWWNVDANGPPASQMNLFSGVIWFTGNETDSVLNGAEQAAIAAYLNGGGNLFITGQNIAQGLTGQPFLSGYFKAELVSPVVNQIQAYGVDGDPVTNGLSLVFAGTGGAGNQTSKDEIIPLTTGVAAMHYAGTAEQVAAVRVDNPYKCLFLACGLEGATGLAGSSSRKQFLQAVMNWFQIPAGIPYEPSATPLPLDFSITGLAPNPFNPDVQISFSLPRISQPELLIYDALGRQAAAMSLGWLAPGEHRTTYQFPASFASGAYFFALKADGRRSIARGFLVK